MLHDHPLIISKPLRTLPANITGWQVLRIALGLILLTAALFKVHELSTTPYLDKFPSRWVMIVFTELEILFALWLFAVSERLTQITRLVSLGPFSFFARAVFPLRMVPRGGRLLCGNENFPFAISKIVL